MFATFDQRRLGARPRPRPRAGAARSIRRATISCSARSFAERSSCSPRWSSTAGSALRRVDPASATVAAPAPLRRTNSSGLAPRNAPSGEPQQKQKQDGKAARSAPKTGRGIVSARARRPRPPARARPSRRRRRGSRSTAVADRGLVVARRRRRCGSSASPLGCGSSKRQGASAQRPSRRPAAQSAPDLPPGPRASAERQERPAAAAHAAPAPAGPSAPAETRTSVRSRPPSGAKAKPPDPHRPGPGGQLRGLVGQAARGPARRSRRPTSAKRPWPARDHLVRACPVRRARTRRVGLLPAEPAVAGQPRAEDCGGRVRDLDRRP